MVLLLYIIINLLLDSYTTTQQILMLDFIEKGIVLFGHVCNSIMHAETVESMTQVTKLDVKLTVEEPPICWLQKCDWSRSESRGVYDVLH